MATIVLVVGSTSSLTNGDTVIQGRLVAAGHTVVLRNDEDAEYTGSYDGVMVADSSSGGTVGSKYDTVAKPGITCENASWRLGSFLGGIDGTQWTVQSVDGNGGYTGTHTVYDTTISQQGIDTDTLPGGATVVARLAGDADHGVYVTYASGGALTSGTAPAKRVFLRIPNAGAPNLTATGEDLLDAAIAWAFAPVGTVHTKTGGAAGFGAGSGARSVATANFIDRAGGGAARGAGSGTRIVTTPHLRTGGAAARAAGSGVQVVTSAPLLPGQVLDLSCWHLTTPADSGDGDAEQINQPELDDYESEFFYVDEDGFVVCYAPVDGFTTSGASGATRAELRQRRKGTYALAAMDPNGSGRWQMTITTSADPTSITGGTNPRQELIIAQIHGAGDSPIPLILSAEWTSGGNPVTPRVRIFKNGPGLANIITGITTSTRLSIRIRLDADAGRLKVWGVAGERTALPPITTSTPYDWPISDFTDQEGWYYKAGAYNKTTITSGSSGQGIAKISFLEILEPTDDDPPASVTYSETGGAAARGAGTGARTLSPAAVHTKTGGGASAVGGSGTRTLTTPAVHTKTGGGDAAAAGSGARSVSSATVHAELGGAAAGAAGSGHAELAPAALHTLSGGAAANAGGSGEGLLAGYVRAGGAAASMGGAGASSVVHVHDRTGAGATSVAGSGSSSVTSATTYDLSGGAAALGAGSGLRQIGGSIEYSKSGGASAAAAGAGARTTQSADVHVRTGSAACSAAGSGAGAVQNAVVHTRAGGASASAAGTGPAQHVPAVRHDRTGGGAVAAAGTGTHDLTASTVHARTGGAATLGAGSGARSVGSAAVHVGHGGAAVRGSGIGLVEVIPASVHVRAGGAVLAVAGSGRGRVGGRLRAAAPVAIGQFRSGTPVRR